ncbi:FAD binding domain protein [Aulographum hederae CBS 113979]|uniref:FAD binding domain protein n=1 Tax=Aulographum hederae CBS 113979 TaxID=1176131 RepID=A0A6G1GVM9_9PEZI|nr:FAD binding domain protein [Aulographum hederae CBS 113979]
MVDSKQMNGGESPTLRVLIAGAGIGGLTTAIGLAQQGHEVIVFEQSRFANETGAALHLSPNSNGILKKLGLDAEKIGGNEMQGLHEYTPEGKFKFAAPTRSDAWQHKWLLVHRIHLHQELKRMAQHPEGDAIPVKLKTSSRIVKVDSKNATVTLENGEEHHGDIVIGADGVHSVCRAFVPGGDVKPFDSGKSAYRFLVPRKELLEDPLTKELLGGEGTMLMVIGDDRRIAMYPCSNNEMTNFVVMHPGRESQASGDWNQQGNKGKLLEIFKSFGSNIQALFGHAPENDLKLWPLLDMEKLPTWVEGRLALLGDAAHPFLPYQGQGGGQAMEDAASLAVIFPKGTPREEIPDRLKLYEECRYERAHMVQHFTRLVGRDASEIPAGEKSNVQEHIFYNLGYDEWHHSTRKLQEWTYARNPQLCWRMPVSFGPMPGPRQSPLGRPLQTGGNSSFSTASIKFKTSRTLLQNLLPNSSYSFISPGTIAYASLSCTTLNNLNWLSGGGYRHFGLSLHGVRYIKKDGSVVVGTFLAVLFENLADPIMTGREELGMPKLYCALDAYRREKSFSLEASWRGVRFGGIELSGLEKVSGSDEEKENANETKTESEKESEEKTNADSDGILTHRYIPSVGRNSKPDADYPVYIPSASTNSTPDGAPSNTPPSTTYKAKKASFNFKPCDWDGLPTLHHIASFLAEMSCIEVVEAKVVDGLGVPAMGDAERVE